MVRNLSCPAVSQICNFTFDSPMVMDLILKSMPMVVMNEEVKESSEYRNNKQDLPTPTVTQQEGGGQG